MPRQPHTSMWLSATAPILIWIGQLDDGQIAVAAQLQGAH
jgi:hypothetical protein